MRCWPPCGSSPSRASAGCRRAARPGPASASPSARRACARCTRRRPRVGRAAGEVGGGGGAGGGGGRRGGGGGGGGAGGVAGGEGGAGRVGFGGGHCGAPHVNQFRLSDGDRACRGGRRRRG